MEYQEATLKQKHHMTVVPYDLYSYINAHATQNQRNKDKSEQIVMIWNVRKMSIYTGLMSFIYFAVLFFIMSAKSKSHLIRE